MLMATRVELWETMKCIHEKSMHYSLLASRLFTGMKRSDT